MVFRTALPRAKHSPSAPNSRCASCGLRVISLLTLVWAIAALGAKSPEGTSENEGALLANGSFETGTVAPEAWRLYPGASWTTGPGRNGEHFVSGSSKRETLMCEGESSKLKPAADYRLDGWVNCSVGEARLGLDWLDEQGRVVGKGMAATVRAAPGWRYVAAEGSAGKASRARVSFRVKGKADLDDVGLAPVAISFIGNKSMEADDRKRIGFWSEEKDDNLLHGRRGGEVAPDTEVKRGGKGSARLTTSGDWCGLASINYPVVPATDRYELSVWARCDGSAKALILACWTDDQQKVLRMDTSPTLNNAGWQRLSLTLIAPTNSSSVRLVAVAEGGRVWFDDAELLRLRPYEPRVKVFVNQVGYNQDGPKNAVVASNFVPPDSSTVKFTLVDSEGKAVSKQEVPCSGRIYGGTENDWGWYFWRADFSTWQRTGQFHARAQLAKVSGESVLFRVGPGAVLQVTAQNAVDFFFIQRCGFDVPGWHKPCHLDDAKLPDGTHLEATGGWHSAGDYNKLMYDHGDGGVVFALLTALSEAPECFGRFDRNADGIPDALDEAMWGAQFVAKMQIPETGGLRNNVNQGPAREWMKWSPPEVHTDNVVGTADDPVIQPGEGNSPLVIGGWARLSTVLDKRGRTNDYLRAAVRLWDHSTKGGTNVGGGYLLLSTLDLHAITHEPKYMDYARRSAESMLAEQAKGGRLQGAFGNYGEVTAAGLASFALACPVEPLSLRIKQALKDYIGFCTRHSANAFGLSDQTAGETREFFPAGLGHNFQILYRAWAAALVYRLNHDPQALIFATDQLDWVLGKNTYNLCLFEGNGTFNPPRYHHRYNSIPGHERGAVPGTVPNGFVREMGMADRPGLDMSRGGNRAPSFRTNEPWLVHNLFYLLAVSEVNLAARDATP